MSCLVYNIMSLLNWCNFRRVVLNVLFEIRLQAATFSGQLETSTMYNAVQRGAPINHGYALVLDEKQTYIRLNLSILHYNVGYGGLQ